MGDTRIDGSSSRQPTDDDACDEATLVCGATPKTQEKLVSDVDDWHPPELPPDHVAIAIVAKNMSTSKPLNEDEEEAWHTRSVADASRTTDSFGVRAEAALHRGENVTVIDATAKASLGHTGIQGTVLHVHGAHDFGGFDVSASGDALTAGLDEGFHNADDSWGFHSAGGAVAVGGEATLHKEGVGSVTVGANVGESVEVSVGVKKAGETTELCARIGAGPITAGVCVSNFFGMVRL